MKDTELVKCAQLDMVIELDRICQCNDISYFLSGGSLIGAIRHNGFIPWDDDVDIGMLRKDYDRFISVCEEQLKSDYALYDWYKDIKSPLPFLKMKIIGTHYVEELSKNTEMNDAIFIDIFPLDYAPDNKAERMMQNIKNIILKKVILLKCGFAIDQGGVLKRLKYFPLRIISLFHSTQKWKRLYDNNAKKYNDKERENTISLGGSYSYNRELRKTKMVSFIEKHQFENAELNVPREYDAFLRQCYGDYMKLPPKDQQKSRHGITFIDIGEYKIKSKLKEDTDR